MYRQKCRFIAQHLTNFIASSVQENCCLVFSIASSVTKILANIIVSLYSVFFSKIVYLYRFKRYIFENRCPPLVVGTLTVRGAGNPCWQIRISTCTVSISGSVDSLFLTPVTGARRLQQSLLARCAQLVATRNRIRTMMTHKCCRCSNRAKHQLIKKFGKHLTVEDFFFIFDIFFPY